jgi:hypothetical protein
MCDATTWIGDGGSDVDDSGVDGSITSVIVIALWRPRNNNLVHRGVDVR